MLDIIIRTPRIVVALAEVAAAEDDRPIIVLPIFTYRSKSFYREALIILRYTQKFKNLKYNNSFIMILYLYHRYKHILKETFFESIL